ncbi:helix-turn-helix domain-containing protein [soil metagenome]
MPIESEDRPSDSQYIHRVWRGQATGTETMTSIATSNWELVFWEEAGIVHAAARGPETAASIAELSGDSTSFGITFAHGASMPHLPVSGIVDGGVESVHATERSFVLAGEEWEIPSFDNAEQFVEKLVRAGLLARDPLVDEVVWGGAARIGSRSVQRRVVGATGLTQGAIRQIDRAREAAALIAAGIPALDVVHRLGYYDQPHLAHALQRFIGRTATQLQNPHEAPDPLSLLYKRDDPGRS